MATHRSIPLTLHLLVFLAILGAAEVGMSLSVVVQQTRFLLSGIQERVTNKACCLLHANFFLGLFFESEDVGYMFFRNVL
jgi:hypothetical protein